MKYILPILILILLGCQEKKQQNLNNLEKNCSKIVPKKEKKEEKNLTKITIGKTTLIFKNENLVYPEKRVFILFDNNSIYCKIQKNILKKMGVTFVSTDNGFLKRYFNVSLYPTIIILDKNKTVKFENLTPYEILKAEGY